MPICRKCGVTIPEENGYCGNCGAAVNPETASASSFTQTQSAPYTFENSDVLSMQLAKEARKSMYLAFAAAGLGLAIILSILVIYFLSMM